MIKRIRHYITKRKKLARLISLVVLFYLLFVIVNVPQIDKLDNPNLIKGAHRGNSIDFKENTIQAFISAAENPDYKFIEFDVQYTSDDKIVVFHQNTMFRFPKKLVDIDGMTLKEIRSRFDFEIPTYNQVMNVVAGKKPLEIEIKSHGDLEKDKKLVDFLMADCKVRKVCNELMISSPSELVVEYVENKYDDVITGRVFWVHPYSIIPIEFLNEKFYESTMADYVLLHGYNLNNYEKLLNTKPDDKGIIFWYFTDEIYVAEKSDGGFLI